MRPVVSNVSVRTSVLTVSVAFCAFLFVTSLAGAGVLRSAPKRDDIRELRLAQRLQGVVIASALDVESVNARIDYETAHLQEVQVYLSARRDRRVDLLNLGNLFIGGDVGAVGSGLQLISSAEHAGNVVSTSAGFGGTVLSVIGLKQQKGQLRSPEYTPADYCVGAG